MSERAFAPAKVNLFLHVGPLGPDGYHPLESWIVFADVGDTVRLEPSSAFEFSVEGAFRSEVPEGADNLVVRARDAVLADHPHAPFRLVLDKVLPPASGIGGGSSDAAAVLRLLDDPSPEKALALGSDVPACLAARSLIARGRGEMILPSPAAPPLPAVLVNPRAGVSTREVFARFDAAAPKELRSAALPTALESIDAVAVALGATRNDLEAPAIAIAPVIGEALSALEKPGVVFRRMSGSGATCFALCEGAEAASDIAERLSRDHPGWWVAATTLS